MCPVVWLCHTHGVRDTTLLSTGQAAEYLTARGFPVSTETLRRWADDLKVRHVKTPGGRLRFHRSDLDAILSPVEPSEATA